jgi:hypothetical protein
MGIKNVAEYTNMKIFELKEEDEFNQDDIHLVAIQYLFQYF